MSNFYIGFTKLEEFIAAADPYRQLNLAPLTYTHRGEAFSTVTAFVIASQVKGDHLIYCKMNAARWEEMAGQPFGDKSAARAARAPVLQHQLWLIAAQIIRTRQSDIILYEGAPSFPTDIMLVDGWPEGAIYDQDAEAIVLKDEAA